MLGAAYLPTDGYIDPSQLTLALAEGARRRGVEIATQTRVTGIGVERGRIAGVETDKGSIETEVVVNAGGMFAAELGRLAGVNVPVIPMAHEYLITKPHGVPLDVPTMRDPSLLVYFRGESGGLVMGGYERHPAPWGLDGIPPDFNGKLLAEDWERFEELMTNALVRVPELGEAEVIRLVNGPEAFTPDGEFILGPTEVPGFWVAAGFCAHGLAGAGGMGKLRRRVDRRRAAGLRRLGDGLAPFRRPLREPRLHARADDRDLLDVLRRQVPRPRAGGRTPAAPLARLSRAWSSSAPRSARSRAGSGPTGSSRTPRPATSRCGPAAGRDGCGRPRSERSTAPAVRAPRSSTRRASPRSTSPARGRRAFLERVCDNRVAREVGQITYTSMLNARGGIECDFTVTRLAEDRFRIVTGTAFGRHDLAWIRQHAPEDGSVLVEDVTSKLACLGLWGPSAREILQATTTDELAFGYMRARELAVGPVPCLALRVTYVGELGWELYCPTEFGLALWDTLWEAGRAHGLVAGGYKAIDSLRLEKGYRVWGADITPDDTPYEAGLGFAVKLDKDDFIGREALLEAQEPERRLACLVLSDPRSVALGSEPVRVDGELVGRVTSGGYGYTVERSIAYAYVPAAHAEPGQPVEVEIFGEWIEGEVAPEPLFDPAGERLRG